jgi:competence protein ComEC
MEQVDPDLVVVSCGWLNRFRFPDRAVLQRYASMGAEILRTDLNGGIQIWTDGQKMNIRTAITNRP